MFFLYNLLCQFWFVCSCRSQDRAEKKPKTKKAKLDKSGGGAGGGGKSKTVKDLLSTNASPPSSPGSLTPHSEGQQHKEGKVYYTP